MVLGCPTDITCVRHLKVGDRFRMAREKGTQYERYGVVFTVLKLIEVVPILEGAKQVHVIMTDMGQLTLVDDSLVAYTD